MWWTRQEADYARGLRGRQEFGQAWGFLFFLLRPARAASGGSAREKLRHFHVPIRATARFAIALLLGSFVRSVPHCHQPDPPFTGVLQLSGLLLVTGLEFGGLWFLWPIENRWMMWLRLLDAGFSCLAMLCGLLAALSVQGAVVALLVFLIANVFISTLVILMHVARFSMFIKDSFVQGKLYHLVKTTFASMFEAMESMALVDKISVMDKSPSHRMSVLLAHRSSDPVSERMSAILADRRASALDSSMYPMSISMMNMLELKRTNDPLGSTVGEENQDAATKQYTVINPLAENRFHHPGI
ncbi:hypothetical protein CYMTET_5599 [Cymbomonas tetramitiformis]|uniref:Uncharacterized protein n=1 Tax=Cymbomonas tetramitiformis TaxID=36881 RepID=A0AAE0GZ80_9CHLO|nr:hypothetical protein CYMTET_5599 [Cymbomonas tetramitiformis]